MAIPSLKTGFAKHLRDKLPFTLLGRLHQGQQLLAGSQNAFKFPAPQ